MLRWLQRTFVIIAIVVLAVINSYFASNSHSRLCLYVIARRLISPGRPISAEDVSLALGQLRSDDSKLISVVGEAISKYPRQLVAKGTPLDQRDLTERAALKAANPTNVVVPIQVQRSATFALEPGMAIGIVQRGKDIKASRTFFLSGNVSLRALAPEPRVSNRVILFLELPVTELNTFSQLTADSERLTPFEIQSPVFPPSHQTPTFAAISFDSNTARIHPAAAQSLDQDAEILKQDLDVTIYLNGYCDASGGTKYNLALSQMRAESVANYLEAKGIATSQLLPRGFGKTNFVAPNNTKVGRARNRRVELKAVR